MASKIIANVLQTHLGQYLELSDTDISFGSKISLKNVRLKESAFSELGLPVKVLHGKVSNLEIDIPWFSIFRNSTTILLEGLHLLVVPSTSVKYDAEEEIKSKLDIKRRQLQRAEDARALQEAQKEEEKDESEGDGNQKKEGESDGFVQKLVANIIKNLEVTISNVHIRYEDKNPNSDARQPFATGITLEELVLKSSDMKDGDAATEQKLRLFGKIVELSKLAFYWKPHAKLFSNHETPIKMRDDDEISNLFNEGIASKSKPELKSLKYLLGPINADAKLTWCLKPESFDYRHPEIDLKIEMTELKISLTKYQYQDFLVLMQTLEFMSRGSAFRKYKARHQLENVPNYDGRSKELWKFAFDCVHEEEVTRRINNWSWDHMKDHVSRCKEYREVYKQKIISGANVKKEILDEIDEYEKSLDVVNIRVQRQLAEREAQTTQEKEKKEKSSSGWFGWWKSTDDKKDDKSEDAKTIVRKNLSGKEKQELYDILEYQEDATTSVSIYPKSFVSRKLAFDLGSLAISICDDEELKNTEVLLLKLTSVQCEILQRPSANNLKVNMEMKELTVKGLALDRKDVPIIVSTIATTESQSTSNQESHHTKSQLLKASFEMNPPLDPNGNLDEDKGDVYDKSIVLSSNPLEIIYDTKTFQQLGKVFHNPLDDVTFTSLQQAASATVNELRESTRLALQYAIDNHSLVKIDAQLNSAHVIVPFGGDATTVKNKNAKAYAVAKLGSISIKSKPLPTHVKEIKGLGKLDDYKNFLDDFKESLAQGLKDQVYDKFDVSLKNVQMLVALSHEKSWKDEMDKQSSPLFLLKPTTINVVLEHCLMKKDPELPRFKVKGRLKSLSVNIADYRLIKLAQIVDSLLTPLVDEQTQPPKLNRADSNDSMQSALSSLNTGSLIQTVLPNTNEGDLDQADIVPLDASNDSHIEQQLTKFKMDFTIDEVSLDLSRSGHNTNKDEDIFNFTLKRMNASAQMKLDYIKGYFEMGSMRCTHLLTKLPNSDKLGVDILNTDELQPSQKSCLLRVNYCDVKESNPDFLTEYNGVLKHLKVELAHVHVNVHQNAIIDFKNQIDKFLEDLSSKAKNLKFTSEIPPLADVEEEDEVKDKRLSTSSSVGLKRKNAQKRFSFGGNRKISIHTSAKVTQWAARARLKLKKKEVIDLKVVGTLSSVTMDLMTSTIHVMKIQVKNLETTFTQTKSQDEITAKLIDFEVFDPVNFTKSSPSKELGEKRTLYEKIVTSMDKRVFNAKVNLYNVTAEEKVLCSDVVDLSVEAEMGRINVVFLMKFVNDFLTFLEPFSEAKTIVAENAKYATTMAMEEAAKAYSNATRVKLDIKMFAPLIIIPIHSKSRKCFIADLGKLSLQNNFFTRSGKVFDEMHVSLKKLNLHRARIADSASSNQVLKQCLIIGGKDDEGINFELEMKRSMEPSLKKTDPAELSTFGTLHEIKVCLSKEDYNVMMALIQENFGEKGQLLKEKESLKKSDIKRSSDRSSMRLPVKKHYGTSSRASSRASVSSGSGKSMKGALQKHGPEKHPETKNVVFDFKFHGLKMEIFGGDTPLGDEVMHHPRTLEVARDQNSSLAKIKIELLSVSGELLNSGFLEAKAFLQNLVLEDSRCHNLDSPSSCDTSIGNTDPIKNENRIVRLLEAKYPDNTNENAGDGTDLKKMIDIIYKQDEKGNQDIEVTVHRFMLVVSISYLMEIANFFIPDQKMLEEFKMYEPGYKSDVPDVVEIDPDEEDKTMSVYVSVEKPDLFLVEDIQDSNSEALMLNTEVQFKYVTTSSAGTMSAMSLISSMREVTCHTCRFKHRGKEQSMAQILKPCDLSLSISQPNGIHGSTRVNTNISDLCLSVSPRGLKIITNSVNTLVQSMADTSETDVVSNQPGSPTIKMERDDGSEDFRDLWHTLPFSNSEFWFLKDDSGFNGLALEATEGSNMNTLSSMLPTDCDEQAIININTLVIQIEAGLGSNTIPLLLLESSFNCDVRNWSSSRMSAIGSMDVEVACYNSKLALWEPVVEANYFKSSKHSSSGQRSSLKRKMIKRRWSANITLQYHSKNDLDSGVLSPNFDTTDGFIVPQNLPPLMALYFQSKDLLEITISKTFLRVLNELQNNFSMENDTSQDNYVSDDDVQAPFVVKNRLGKTINVVLENKTSAGNFHYSVAVGDQHSVSRNQVEVPDGDDLYLELHRDRYKMASVYDEYISPLREQTEQADVGLKLRIDGEKGIFDLPVSKADKRFFPFQYRGDEMGDDHGMVSEITVRGGCKTLTLRSILQFRNYFSKPIDIYKDHDDVGPQKLGMIQPEESFNVPISSVYSKPYAFQFKIAEDGQNMGLQSYPWREIKTAEDRQFSQQIECANSLGAQNVLLNVSGEEQSVFKEKSGKLGPPIYNMDIRPLVIIKNCLPETLHYTVCSFEDRIPGMDSNTGWPDPLLPGAVGHLQGVRFGNSKLMLKIFSFRQMEWTCTTSLENNMPELSTWKFMSEEFMTTNGTQRAELDLGVNCTSTSGTQIISVYAPFWMINKTGKMLTYGSKDPLNEIHHTSDSSMGTEDPASIPMMFSYTSNSGGILSGKRKAKIKIDDSNWSESFTLDTIEDAGKITCQNKSTSQNTPEKYHIGVNIQMSKSSWTKIITFTPFYVIQNTTNYKIELKERDTKKFNVQIRPQEAAPFWPIFGAKEILARICDTKEMTTPFSLEREHTTLLMLSNRHGGLNVEVRKSNSETMLTLSTYKKGHAPVQLINQTSSVMIEYGEYNTFTSKQFLPPGEKSYFTWTDPNGKRKLSWSVAGLQEEYINELNGEEEQRQGFVEVPSYQNAGTVLYWVSFLEGMQRILLFTEDNNLCIQLANATGENERLTKEVEISFAGIGISLVNNLASNLTGDKNYEILYMRMSSSEVVWEIRKQGKSRYKSLTKAQCEAIEADFQRYSREKTVAKKVNEFREFRTSSRDLIQLNYLDSRMIAPFKGAIKRQFQQGVWAKLGMSDHQTQIHAKVNHVQIDNQLTQCLFPVMLAPVPPPRSVVADSIPKPFFELSILEYHTTDSTIKQYKYISALVQELAIKVDQGLINALVEMFGEEDANNDDKIKEFLEEDLKLATRTLKEVVSLHVMQGHKDFFDYLHLSPLKVHVSFSLTSYKAGKASKSNIFGLFLQSLGVTITDTDDIVFRLAYFERKHSFYSTDDVFQQMTRHYTSQAIKQAYVILLGLDVIGNPFGLVVGVSQSVEDLFYEPFQGAVEGPGEFAEGLVIGMRSVFSGVFGGAAGTVSRITNSIGKGLSYLTFDEKFKNKRRENIKKRSQQNFGESMARSGKGLVMGVFDGITGVATKPIEGAMEEGVGGFFKGFGKGVVGLVTRPTGGLVDSASGIMDAAKRATDIQINYSRMRPPRFFHADGVVRYYNFKEAEGAQYLRELEKGKYKDDTYITHEKITAADRKSVLLLSNKQIFFIVYNQMMGNWSIEWKYSLPEITGPPAIENDNSGADNGMNQSHLPTDQGDCKAYLYIKPKEESKKTLGMFGGNTQKKVTLPNRHTAKDFANKIEEARIQCATTD